MKKSISYIILTFFAILAAKSELKMPAIFGNNMVFQQQADVKIWGWADKGQTITVSPSWAGQTYSLKADNEGKWSIRIPTPTASFDTYSINVSDKKSSLAFKNILIGEVWLCSGQSNMEMPMKGFKNQPVTGSNEAIMRSKNRNIRFITIKRTSTLSPQEDIVGEWVEASPETVKNLSATAYYYAKLLNEMLDIPVGLIVPAWGGSWIESWMSKEMLNGFDKVKLPQKEEDIKEKNRTPTTLYNGMINPIVGYTIAGCIWYQGESNYDRADEYLPLFTTMVSEWRKYWGQGEFPFYYCQIAPYNYASIASEHQKGSKYNSALFREAQYNAAKEIPNSGMVVLMDIGEEFCIHPQNKQMGGERLAIMALAKNYGMKDGFAYESPTFKEMEIENNKAILTFENAPMWLTAYGKELKTFEIAGEDKIFYPAKAKINRSKIEVYCDEVSNPVAVRYAFKDFVVGDLFSTEGFPVSSFRTDNWDE